MSNTERLVVSIIHFLGEQLRGDTLSTDSKESLEIAIQCLESAFNVSSSDTHLMVSKSLQEVFNEVANREPVTSKDAETNHSDKEEAERLKREGNELMKMEKYEEALKNYTGAIQLDCKNPVYFCNRAAAYSKLNNHVFALEDCQRAIEIDPNYSKAYGRMGLAYASLNDHAKAKQFYEKAIELDPHNESFRKNLKIAEEKALEAQNQNPFGAFGNMDLNSIMQNPVILDLARRIARDEPGTNDMFAQMLNSFDNAMEQNANSGENPPSNLSSFFRAGQQFIERMQQTNPELIEQLRSQFNNITRDGSQNQSQ